MVKQYICIDLKSFYASVECVKRGLDPLDTNLVVADKSRTEKTICLAVSPSLKKYKIPGRARLFEVVQKVKNVNSERLRKTKGKGFCGKSYISTELAHNPNLELDYIVAPPHMALYMEYSTRIYSIYLKFVAPEDIHVYSVDEVFMDVTKYLNTYGLTARELALKIIREVLEITGITATAGIGTNMYLAKVAMDIEAKKMPPDNNGVRIAELDEMTYRQKLWNHRPITDFWRVGAGYSKKLEANGMFTMGDVARRSVTDEDKLYKLFGINAELLIDHAWGWEPCTIDIVKAYKPSTNSLGHGQVLKCPYNFDMGKTIIKEMADNLVFELLDKHLVTDQLVLTIGYDIQNLKNSQIEYSGEITTDFYGRRVPKNAHGTANLKAYTSSAILITDAALELYQSIVNPSLFIRRLNITANHVIDEQKAKENAKFEQLNFFDSYGEISDDKALRLDKEKRLCRAMLEIKKQFGKNSVLKGTSLKEGATAMERNNQIGGHKA